jgi:hypothetical protein
MKKIIFGAVALSLAAIACKKETDTESPVITINRPVQNETFASNEVIISFKAEDADLHEVGFTLRNAVNDSLLYELPMEHSHDNPFVFDKTLSIDLQKETDVILEVSASDHNGNADKKSVSFAIR